MEQKKKIKVAMICHFSNAFVRENLSLGDPKYLNVVLKMLGRDPRVYFDFAPWISNIAYQCENNEDIELHVIASHYGMHKDNMQFQHNGVWYHFYKGFPPRILIAIDDKLFKGKLVTEYNHNSKKVCRYVKEIDPDLVVLVGAENAQYASSVLNIKDKPIFVLCQTVLDNPEYAATCNNMVSYNRRVNIERRILQHTKYVAVYSDKHRDLLRKIGYKGYIFDFNWPSGALFVAQPCEKKDFDFVNFANGMSLEKGYHDCIKALATVKKYYPEVRLALIDRGPVSVREELLELIDELGLKNNVTFIPFFEKKSDLFQFLVSVRFAVLPCKVDHISGTMHQAMGRGLPTVVYKTTGTPSLNAKKECVLIAEMENIDDLAQQMLRLMDNPELASRLSANSREYMVEYRKQNEGQMERLIEEFKAVMNNYYEDKDIPAELLGGE